MKALVIVVRCINIAFAIILLLLFPFAIAEQIHGLEAVIWLVDFLHIPINYKIIVATMIVSFVVWVLSFFLLRYFAKKGYWSVH